jgi:hypothetical protein
MSHPFNIEYAAAERRAADLKAGAEAQLLRTAREEMIVQRRFSRLVARIRRYTHWRTYVQLSRDVRKALSRPA